MVGTENVDSTKVLDEALVVPAPVTDSVGGIRIAGYELAEKLGAGGYGEVWKAIGPGGLPKAVKVLYGERTGQHAEAELKALERMRDLRHPFLLNIERIEVVDSRLVVVTELADCNLSERFEQCQADGLPGIPRDELLGYLRDTADALDFMAEQHGLQHLDIKPDNLLLQGQHAKVGDFGLAKDISATNVSVINGFTPTFAAPELFEGRPGRASDQYSMAIVYQLMLTGSAPFNGRTAAQLTAQHLRSQPDLSSLQPIDRPVVARALSKKMSSRFDNCRRFVEELARRQHSRVKPRRSPQADVVPKGSNTTLMRTQGIVETDVLAEETSVPVKCSGNQPSRFTRRRSIFIGSGGVAGEVLAQVKRHLTDATDLSDVAFLHLDSDRLSFTELRSMEDQVGLEPDELVAIPLRSSREYRSDSELDLTWMSRRWLFNIPRSGQVEGIRPLGRLALFDHRQTVFDRIEQLVSSAASDRSEDCGLDIYVVAAISGGTGSGTAADLGLMIQRIRRRLAPENSAVHAILIHGTGSVRNMSDVHEANTVCTLQEIRHLQTPGVQSARGFEDCEESRETLPFDNTYFVHIGSDLNAVNFDSRVEEVAGYLAASTTETAQACFHTWRSAQDSSESATQVRLIGVGRQDAGCLKAANEESGRLGAMVLRHWCESSRGDADGEQPRPVELPEIQTLLPDLKLTPDTFHEQVMSIVRGDCGRSIETCAQRAYQHVADANDLAEITKAQLVEQLSDHLTSGDRHDDATFAGILTKVQSTLKTVTTDCQNAVVHQLRKLLDTPHRLGAARVACSYTTGVLNQSQAQCGVRLAEIEAMAADLHESSDLDSSEGSPGFDGNAEAVQNFCRQHCGLLAYRAIYQCFQLHLKTVESAVTKLSATLDETEQFLSKVAAGVAAEDDDADAIPQPIVDEFDRQLRSEFPTLLAELSLNDSAGEQLAQVITAQAKQFLLTAVNDRKRGGDDSSSSEFPENAWPRIRGLGGRRRVLGMIPPELSGSEWNDRLKEEFGDCVAVRQAQTEAISVFCEIEGVAIDSVVDRLTRSNPHIEDVAGRIHTRIDVDW